MMPLSMQRLVAARTLPAATGRDGLAEEVMPVGSTIDVCQPVACQRELSSPPSKLCVVNPRPEAPAAGVPAGTGAAGVLQQCGRRGGRGRAAAAARGPAAGRARHPGHDAGRQGARSLLSVKRSLAAPTTSCCSASRNWTVHCRAAAAHRRAALRTLHHAVWCAPHREKLSHSRPTQGQVWRDPDPDPDPDPDGASSSFS